MAEHCNCGAERPKPPLRIPATGEFLVRDGKVWSVGIEDVTDTIKYVYRKDGWK